MDFESISAVWTPPRSLRSADSASRRVGRAALLGESGPRSTLDASLEPRCAGATRSPTRTRRGSGRASASTSRRSSAEEARYNIAPTDPVLAIRRSDGGERQAGRLRWGLIPGRWAERRSGPPLINARAETLASQPAFAESFRERRCLIPADGFYEWRHDEGGEDAGLDQPARRRPVRVRGHLGRACRHATARPSCTAARSSPASRTR